METTTEDSMAEISEEAVLDENISDEDLENLLEDAGYTTEEESNDDSETMEEDTINKEESMEEENNMNDSVETGTNGTDESTEL
ncbi:MAG: hypothetical protein R3B65_02740 [Candidatus Paceibacterota bacterium]